MTVVRKRDRDGNKRVSGIINHNIKVCCEKPYDGKSSYVSVDLKDELLNNTLRLIFLDNVGIDNLINALTEVKKYLD